MARAARPGRNGGSRKTPPPDPAVTVVGVGASAGGVNALQAFFEALPPDPGAAFVVIVHLDPQARSELPEILAARAKMPVTQVTETTKLSANCIYVIPPDRQLRISDEEISAEPFREPRGQRAPIDLFFRSLADQHRDGFAVILTGAGSDGAVGVKAVKEGGGIILVQDPDEAEYPSMPRSAIATGVADFILPVKTLANQLYGLIKAREQTASEIGEDQEEVLRRILAHLRVRTGHDFQHYKRSTVLRRVARRMQVTREETLEDYWSHLRENAEEAQALLADLLISVTTFFRDPKAFDVLAKRVIPTLFADRAPNEPIRGWIVGSATGEEAYSIGMLLFEEAARHDVRPEIQLFASDIDARSLAVARDGRYPAAIEADVSEDRLRRFFSREDDYYRVKRELRDIVLFANHSVLKDPPFSKLDLISCRNLLIYLDRDLQQQVISTLHYGLNPDGYLFLGTSEAGEHPEGIFRVVDRDARIYQSTGRGHDRVPPLPRLMGAHPPELASILAPPNLGAVRTVQNAHRQALEAAAPPSILVDDAHRVLHLSETAGRYLQPSGGPLTADIVDLVRQELRFELRAALNRTLEQHTPSLTPTLYVQFNGSPVRVYIQVKPVGGLEGEKERRRALILFIEGEAAEPPGTDASVQGASGAVQRLMQELELARSRLRTTREESETANEELRAANEELQSINEEYRSTAEELETSKEELQSINEELQTVNAELKLKLDTVSRANSDLQNLVAAMDFGTLFLDSGLRIKRFTPRLVELFSLTPGDIGRPITDFAHQLEYDDLAGDALKVLKDLITIEKEVRSRAGQWYLARFRPYRTTDDKIDGVVATFVDISDRLRMEEALRVSEEALRQEMRLVELSRAPIFIWDFDGGILQWNRGCEDLYGYSKEEAVGRDREELLKPSVPNSSFEAVMAALLETGVWEGEIHQETKSGRKFPAESQIELMSNGGRRYVLESTRDIAQSKAWAARQRLLLSELTHRVKNVLTIVQSIVHQTWRSGSRDDFIERVDRRVAALADSHNLLVESEWRGADLRALIQNQAMAYMPNAAARVHLSGPSVMLPPDLATPLGLVVHELATNAAKYGALSGDKGEVDLAWSVSRRNQRPLLKVVWREHDGPPVAAPSGSGFGSRLIRQGLAGATVKHEFLPQGVQCEIEVPLPPAEDGGAPD